MGSAVTPHPGSETETEYTHNRLQAIDYGTLMVAGVNPKKAGQTHLNLPIFGSVRDAAESTGKLSLSIWEGAQCLVF